MTRPFPSAARERPRPDSFERFYLQHVSINEGCGCAELLVRNFLPKGEGRELRAAPSGLLRRLRARLFGWID